MKQLKKNIIFIASTDELVNGVKVVKWSDLEKAFGKVK